MNKTKPLIGLAVAILVAGGVWMVSQNSMQAPAPQDGIPPVSTTTPQQPVSQVPAPPKPVTPTPIPPVKKPPVVIPPVVIPPVPVVPVTPSGPTAFTMAQIASHNSASSCYSAINGSVYDLTPFIRQHPGGSARILSICGIDGTAAFMDQHSGQSQPQQILTGLKIGVLAR